MRITSRDILGEVFTFQGWQTQFFTLSVVESCQLQCDKKNVIKISGKTSHIPIIFPLMPVWLKEEFQEGVTFRLCCKEAGCCIQVTTMSKPMIKSTVQKTSALLDSFSVAHSFHTVFYAFNFLRLLWMLVPPQPSLCFSQHLLLKE